MTPGASTGFHGYARPERLHSSLLEGKPTRRLAVLRGRLYAEGRADLADRIGDHFDRLLSLEEQGQGHLVEDYLERIRQTAGAMA